MLPSSKLKFWFLLVVYEALSAKDRVHSYQDIHISQRELLFSPRVVNEYASYSDMEIFALAVPELTSALKVYFSITSKSSVCKQSSVEVYYQYGGPPLPPHQTFPSNGTYTKRDFAGNVVLSTDTKKPLLFQEAMPGTWYLGVVVPKSNGIKTRSELGFGNSSSDICSFDVGMRAVITVVNSVPFLPSDGEFRTDELALQQHIRYYRYQHLNASSHLIVKISGCYSVQDTGKKLKKLLGFCPLTLSVRSRALPDENSLSIICTHQGQDPCLITIPTLEQEMWNYYITAKRLPNFEAYCILYNISVMEVGCSPRRDQVHHHNRWRQLSLDPACVPVQEMIALSTEKVLNMRFISHTHNSSVSIRADSPTFFSFEVSPDHVGSMLNVQFTYQRGSSPKILICLQKDFVPTFYKKSYDDRYYSMNCSGQAGFLSQYMTSRRLVVPFPARGIWYVSLYAESVLESYTDVAFYAEMQACSGDCNSHGTCNIYTKPDIVYGLCSCDAGYTSWACDRVTDVDLARVLLLTISNVAFIIDAMIAAHKKLYPETLVYLFMLVISTLYHLCGSGVVCAMDESFLQTCDLFAILLSVWVTLVVLTNHRQPAFAPTLNMLAVLVLFVSVREAYRSVLPFILTVCFGVLLVIMYNVMLWCQKIPTASFSKKRWALFIIPATIMILMSFVCFAFLETEDNYKYIHSLGHVLLGIGIALLLPNHRPYARTAHYNLVRELDGETREESSRRSVVNEVRHV